MQPYRRTLLFALPAFCALGCTTTYHVGDGPPRADSELATLVAVGCLFDAIDGKEVAVAENYGALSKHMLAPGPHTIRATLDETRNNVRRRSRTPLEITFVFEAGKSYILRPEILGTKWRPIIRERGTAEAAPAATQPPAATAPTQ